MRSFLESGASVYSQWNMVLDQSGKSGWGWSQCSPVTVFTDTKQVSYEGSYWATKHFSSLIEPGAVLLGTGGDNGRCQEINGACGCAQGCGNGGRGDTAGVGAPDQYISFRNPNGDIVIVGLNANGVPRHLTLSVDGEEVASALLPPHSMNTFVVHSAGKQRR